MYSNSDRFKFEFTSLLKSLFATKLVDRALASHSIQADQQLSKAALASAFRAAHTSKASYLDS